MNPTIVSVDYLVQVLSLLLHLFFQVSVGADDLADPVPGVRQHDDVPADLPLQVDQLGGPRLRLLVEYLYRRHHSYT